MTNRRQPFIIDLLQFLSTHPAPNACLVIYVFLSKYSLICTCWYHLNFNPINKNMPYDDGNSKCQKQNS